MGYITIIASTLMMVPVVLQLSVHAEEIRLKEMCGMLKKKGMW